jgi:hypothetical protein
MGAAGAAVGYWIPAFAGMTKTKALSFTDPAFAGMTKNVSLS